MAMEDPLETIKRFVSGDMKPQDFRDAVYTNDGFEALLSNDPNLDPTNYVMQDGGTYYFVIAQDYSDPAGVVNAHGALCDFMDRNGIAYDKSIRSSDFYNLVLDASLPCPACGFLTIYGDSYGTFSICPICGWEDDAVQLANPACGGGANDQSLIEAQLAALSEHPLTETTVDGIERDCNWRPISETERETAETEKKTKYWRNKAVYDSANGYWKKSATKRIYEIDGSDFSTLEEFYDVISRTLIPGAQWGRNLDAFNDILRGGFGTPDRGFVIRWRNSHESQERLGYPETVRQLEYRLQRCHPSNVSHVRDQLAAAKSGNGPTVYDWLVEIIRVHCAGGEESVDGVELELE